MLVSRSQVTGLREGFRFKTIFLRISAILALIASTSVMMCGCGTKSAPPLKNGSGPLTAPAPLTAGEKLTGRWRYSECNQIRTGVYKNYFQSKVLIFTPTSSEVIPTVYIDERCNRPAIQFESGSNTDVKIVDNIPGHPELIGLNITLKGSTVVNYTSALIKGNTLQISTEARNGMGTTSEKRSIPNQRDPTYTKENLLPGSTIDGLANISLKSVYQSECMALKNEADGSERCTLQFNQTNKKLDFFRLGFKDSKCAEIQGNSYLLEPIIYESLKLSSTEDGIFGFATGKTGFIVQFRIFQKTIQLEGVGDGSEPLILTEIN